MKVTPFETYQSYLSMKNHFTNRKYDFFRYDGKTNATMASFNKRKDKYWFEKTSRKYSDSQIVDFLLANFVTTDNPKNLWIGEIINSGERTYADWTRRQQSISYLFKEESNKLLEENNFVIYDIIFSFSEKFDEKLFDPVWETVSLKIRKYKPFLNINVFQFKKILREIVDV